MTATETALHPVAGTNYRDGLGRLLHVLSIHPDDPLGREVRGRIDATHAPPTPNGPPGHAIFPRATKPPSVGDYSCTIKTFAHVWRVLADG